MSRSIPDSPSAAAGRRMPTGGGVAATIGACTIALALAVIPGTAKAQERGAAAAPAAVAGPPQAFRTRTAGFEPQPWEALPGWSQDAHLEALTVFVSSCASLQRRTVWQSACDQARALGGADNARAKAFFESAFVPYRLQPVALDDPALLTGYFEPVLDGALQRGGRFVHPVFGPPADLVLLDARRVRGDGPIHAIVANGEAVPVGGDTPSPAGAPVLRVDREALVDEPLDRRFRLRVDGDRLVRYWSRAEIDRGRAAATPIAWVADPDALYVMQVQGSGSVRLPDGRMLRLGYADQNGHPFRPTRSSTSGIRTRSIDPSAPQQDADDTSQVAPPSATTLALIGEAPSMTRAVGDPPPASRAVGEPPQVQRVIDALLAQPQARAGSATGSASIPSAPPRAGVPTPPAPPKPVPRPTVSTSAPSVTPLLAETGLARLVAARSNDPSYVFFRPITAPSGGPLGALGIPLTARRSIAVDPRVTPLGAPVFIESGRRGTDSVMRRLMFAQDTGGAIRGVVRGDFFWGTGPDAGREAFRTRDALSMWVLLPQGFVGSSAEKGLRTRSIAAPTEPDCTIPDEAFC